MGTQDEKYTRLHGRLGEPHPAHGASSGGRSRLRALQSDGRLTPLPAKPGNYGRGYGQGGGEFVKGVPADLRRQTPSGMTRRMAGNLAEHLDQAGVEEQIAEVIISKVSKAVRAFDPTNYLENVSTIPFTVGTQSSIIRQRPATKRQYLFLINTHATQRLFFAFDRGVSSQDGVPLAANLGFFEWLERIPQGEIDIIGAGANTTGVLLVSESEHPSTS